MNTKVAKKEDIIKMDFPRLCIILNNMGGCCLAALPAVAKYYGKEFTPEQFEYLFNLAKISPGLDERDLGYYFQPLHIEVEIKTHCDTGDIRKALKAGIPCGVVYKPHESSHGTLNMSRDDHFAIVVGLSTENIYLADIVFCDGQLVDWRPLKRFKEKWYDTGSCGFPDYIDLGLNKALKKLIFFHGDKRAKNFDNIWHITQKLKQRYHKPLTGGWKKGELEEARKSFDSNVRTCEEGDREVFKMGGWAAHREWLEKKLIESGDYNPDPPTRIECPEMMCNTNPEEDARWLARERAKEAVTPKELYECYVKGWPLPVPGYY